MVIIRINAAAYLFCLSDEKSEYISHDRNNTWIVHDLVLLLLQINTLFFLSIILNRHALHLTYTLATSSGKVRKEATKYCEDYWNMSVTFQRPHPAYIPKAWICCKEWNPVRSGPERKATRVRDVITNLPRAQQRQLYSRGARLRQFSSGGKGLVLLSLSSSKLLAKWRGPTWSHGEWGGRTGWSQTDISLLKAWREALLQMTSYKPKQRDRMTQSTLWR